MRFFAVPSVSVSALFAGALFAAAFFAASPALSVAAPPAAPRPAEKTPARVLPAPAQVRLEMHLTRSEKDASATAPDTVIATPSLTTLDRGTATVSVTSKELSYSISASPAIEQTDKTDSTVQVLWNVRLSGRSLPEGTTAVTTTGATRIDPASEHESLLTYLPITDTKTGRVTRFQLTLRVIVTPAESAGPKVAPAPPTAPAAS